MSRAKDASARSAREIGFYLLLVLLPLLAYARLATAGFLWDDDAMITVNPLVLASDGLSRIWFSTHALDYWPVTYSTLWAEWRIWGNWAPGYHLTSLALHIGEGILLWRLLLRLRIPGAFFAALWFALHPINVESVAWIAQQKNLLAMLFFLLSLRAFAESSALESGRLDRWCGLAWAAFLLALLSKGSTVPLPLVLIGCVLWRRRLGWKDAPWLGVFLATAVVMAWVNIWFSHKSGGGVIRLIGWPARIAGAGGAIWFYLGKIVWPAPLSFIYPHWIVPPVDPLWWVGLGLAAALTAGLWLGRNRGTKPELAAWLYFGAMLLPVLGLTDVYFMKFSLVADHYAHLALIGIAAWAAARWTQLRWPPALAGGISLALGLLTFQRTGLFQDNAVLFRSVLVGNPDSVMAHTNLGFYLERSGQAAAAAAEYRAAIALQPDLPGLYNNLGTALAEVAGRLNEAVAAFQEALKRQPDFAEAHYNLGDAWIKLPGRLNEAIAEYQEAIRWRPGFADAHYKLGGAWMSVPGRAAEAAKEFQASLRLRPDFPDAHNSLGGVWMNEPGREDEAIAEFQAAVRLKPDFVAARYNLGNALTNTPGRASEGVAQFEAALRFQPNLAALHLGLAIALLHTPGRTPEAVSHLETALRLEPDNDMARKILAQVQASPP
jgi:tetratricopeptide (TPR) repeat protein